MNKKNKITKWILGSAVAGLVASGASFGVTPQASSQGDFFQYSHLKVGYNLAHAEEKTETTETQKGHDGKCGQDGSCGKDAKNGKDAKEPSKDTKEQPKDASKGKDSSCGKGACGSS